MIPGLDSNVLLDFSVAVAVLVVMQGTAMALVVWVVRAVLGNLERSLSELAAAHDRSSRATVLALIQANHLSARLRAEVTHLEAEIGEAQRVRERRRAARRRGGVVIQEEKEESDGGA